MLRNYYNRDELYEIVEQFRLKKGKAEYTNIDFKDLMSHRIEKILMVCSIYDYYTIIEDGHLQEAIFNEYLELNLYYAPNITRTYNADTALKLLEDEEFDLIITTQRLGNIEPDEFCRIVKSKRPDIPLVLLGSHSRELEVLLTNGKLSLFDKIFIWTGDRRIFLAIIKLFEDLSNADYDCLEYGVPAILLVEDSPSFYSSFLPLIYTEVMKQTQRLIQEGKSSAQKMLRQRARPKILHAINYEQAWNYFLKFREHLLGIITDLTFTKDGSVDENAGIELIRNVHYKEPLVPILVQTSDSEKKDLLLNDNIRCLDKNSRTLLFEIGEFMRDNFGFGDFIFRMPDGTEINRAKNLRQLRDIINYIPDESLEYHSRHNHFSHWLIARTEFELAYKIRPVHISQFKNVGELRSYLVNSFSRQLRDNNRGNVIVYSRRDYEEYGMFQMIGEGSVGGKARGLAFIDKILKNYLEPNYFHNVEISIPRTIVVGTEVFSNFMEQNNLYPIAVENLPDEQLMSRFMQAELPPTVIGDIGDVLNHIEGPIAVRSSSLLEDAMYQPFAGVYSTVMIPNSSNSKDVRFMNLVQAIKLVYASTFTRKAKNYMEATGNRIEEERMAVILQELVGSQFHTYFYPHFSGVARSFNYYPFGKAKPGDGIVNLALGLGKTIVDGGISLQYSPSYPGVYPQFASQKDYFTKSQVKFFALDLTSDYVRRIPKEDQHLIELGINHAEKHGSLKYIASTYSADNDILYEGVSKQGPRVINFAPILRSNIFPLNEIIKLMLKMSEVSLNSPVEIEFAVTLSGNEPNPVKFSFLQVRPMVKLEGNAVVNPEEINPDDILIMPDMSLGNGTYKMNKVLYVKYENFNGSKTRQIARQISDINEMMLKEKSNYLLIGPGRWGSSDPWLGIPVDFSAISNARAIVEVPMPETSVDPSQGSHFFQNLTSFKIAYLTVKNKAFADAVDWKWLDSLQSLAETEYIKLVASDRDIEVRIDGTKGMGVVLKGKY